MINILFITYRITCYENFFFFFLDFLSTTAIALTETIKVAETEKGSGPSVIKVDSKKETIVSVTRKTDSTCAGEIVFVSKK